MFEDLADKLMQIMPSLKKKEEEPEVQSCYSRYQYASVDEKGNEKVVYGFNFVRDPKDAIERARIGVQGRGELEKVWIAFFNDDDPKLDLIFGRSDEGDVSIPISEDRVVETMYKHYKEKIKVPKEEKKARADTNRRTKKLNRSEKPRIRMPLGPTVVVQPEVKPAFRRWNAVSASDYVAPAVQPVKEKPVMNEEEVPWSEFYGH